MQDRAILSKFSTHRVSQQCTIGNFQKIFLSPKMAAILNFQIFAKTAKTLICFYLLNCVRYCDSSKFSSHRVSYIYSCHFSKENIPLPKNGGHFEFSHFCQKCKKTNLLLSP